MKQLKKRLKEIEPAQKRKEKFNQALEETAGYLKKNKKVLAIILFGSMARGEVSPRHSDIDLFVFIDLAKSDAELEKKLLAKAIEVGNKYKVIIHLTFQYRKVEEEDKSLIKKLVQEGRVLYSKKMLIISDELLGFKPFELIIFDTKGTTQLQRTKFSRFLHGAKLWYKKDGKKVVKKYEGIIDNKEIFGAGKGALLIAAKEVEKFQELAEEIGVKVRSKGLFYR